LPTGQRWEVFKLRLVENGTRKAKVLVVVVTPALFRSRACLKEINITITYGMHVIPLVFGTDLPEEKEQWTGEEFDDSHDTRLARLNAQKALCNGQIPFREHFCEPAQLPMTLEKFINDVRKELSNHERTGLRAQAACILH